MSKINKTFEHSADQLFHHLEEINQHHTIDSMSEDDLKNDLKRLRHSVQLLLIVGELKTSKLKQAWEIAEMFE